MDFNIKTIFRGVSTPIAKIEAQIEEKEDELTWNTDMTNFERDELEDEIDDLYETLKEIQINIILKNEAH